MLSSFASLLSNGYRITMRTRLPNLRIPIPTIHDLRTYVCVYVCMCVTNLYVAKYIVKFNINLADGTVSRIGQSCLGDRIKVDTDNFIQITGNGDFRDRLQFIRIESFVIGVDEHIHSDKLPNCARRLPSSWSME